VTYWQRGLDEPKEVVCATEKYHQESDSIGRFIAERCVIEPTSKVEPKRLHEAWVKWQTDDGCESVGLKAFNVAMEERGYPSGKPSNGKRYRNGIGLRALDQKSEIAEQNK
jgi:putative DNA primase/helicase